MRFAAVLMIVFMACAATAAATAAAEAEEIMAEAAMDGVKETPHDGKVLEIFDETSYKVPVGFYPSGWMGDYAAVKVNYSCSDRPRRGSFCQRWEYSGKAPQGVNWAGVSFQYPEHNYGQYEGRDLTGYNKLTFWVKGENGGEKLIFRIGGNNDSLGITLDPMKLTGEWQKITIDLSGYDLSSVGTAFMWSATSTDNPDGCVFYLDDIKFEE